MNIDEHLLTCLAEEAAEVAQDCCKALRFGLDDRNVNNPTGPTNRDRIVTELNQLIAVFHMLVRRKALPEVWGDHDTRAKKVEAVEKFMIYAQGVGALSKIPTPDHSRKSSRPSRTSRLKKKGTK